MVAENLPWLLILFLMKDNVGIWNRLVCMPVSLLAKWKDPMWTQLPALSPVISIEQKNHQQ